MAGKPFVLQAFKIVKLKKFDGTNKDGDAYVKFVFSIDHEKAPADDFEFHYFADPDASETWPYTGAAVKEMVGEIGKYRGENQYNVKKIIYDQNPSKKEKPYPEEYEKQGRVTKGDSEPPEKVLSKDTPLWFCISYVKDLQQARLAYMPHDKIPDLMELIDEVERGGSVLYDNLKNKYGRVS